MRNFPDRKEPTEKCCRNEFLLLRKDGHFFSPHSEWPLKGWKFVLFFFSKLCMMNVIVNLANFNWCQITRDERNCRMSPMIWKTIKKTWNLILFIWCNGKIYKCFMTYFWDRGIALQQPCDPEASLPTNGSTAFIWKLCCHWLKGLWQYHVAFIRPTPWIRHRSAGSGHQGSTNAG